jgi:hydroxymethylbilane synthase
VLAAAGVDRMGWSERVAERLDVATFTPAPGQGALGVECREDDASLRTLLATIVDPVATAEVEAERAFLRAVGGGCRAPLAATSRVEGDRMRIWAMFANEEMTRVAFSEDEADVEDGPALAAALARQLKTQVDG